MTVINYKVVFDGQIDENLKKMIENGFLEVVIDAQTNIVIGVDLYEKIFNLYGKEIKAQVWILNQGDMFKTIKAMYYKGANLVIYVKSNNSSTVEKLIDSYKNARINPSHIILLENTEDFTEAFFEYAIVITLYQDGLLNINTFRERQLDYQKGKNPKYTVLIDYLESEEYEIKNLKNLLHIKEEEVEELRELVSIKDKQINNLKASLQSKDKLIRSQINEMKIIANSVKLKEKELEDLRKELKLKDKQINSLNNTKT
ncbi:MAG: hypothetical protein ACFE8L_03215 [Candidatus Hodarchaeota archaeon]